MTIIDLGFRVWNIGVEYLIHDYTDEGVCRFFHDDNKVLVPVGSIRSVLDTFLV
jgi:hypothetical protein